MKPANAKRQKNDLTFLVFKDHLRSRGFSIPLRWVSRLSYFYGILIMVSFLATVAAIKFWHQAKSANPNRLTELENEIAELHKKMAAGYVEGDQTDPSPHKNTVVAETSESLLFSSFPKTLQIPAKLSDLPVDIGIELHDFESRLVEEGLKFNFNIYYTKKDGGSLQGRFLLLARSSGAVFSYPAGAIIDGSQNHLIDPRIGEYFSVGRFRAVNAFFNSGASEIKSVQIYIFDRQNQLISANQVAVQKKKTIQEGP